MLPRSDSWLNAIEEIEASPAPPPPPEPEPEPEPRRTPRTPRSKRAALLLAAKRGRADVVRFLLAKGTSVDSAERAPETTPLMAAATRGHAPIVALLVDAGADLERVDGGRCTALVHAARKGRDDVVGVLLAHGADPSATDEHGFTALCCAAWKGHAAVVARLIAEGVDQKTKIDKGLYESHTPLSLARLRGHKRIACMLALSKNRAWSMVPQKSRSYVLRKACPADPRQDPPTADAAPAGTPRKRASSWRAPSSWNRRRSGSASADIS